MSTITSDVTNFDLESEANIDEPAKKPSALSIFRQRDFKLLWIGEAISLIGDQFYMIALPWLVLQLTGNALAMGTVLALAGIPRALFMLVGGALTDRFTPRMVMLASNLLRMLLVSLLAVIIILVGLAYNLLASATGGVVVEMHAVKEQASVVDKRQG